MRIERYLGRVIGWRSRSGRPWLIDALTARVESVAVDCPAGPGRCGR